MWYGHGRTCPIGCYGPGLHSWVLHSVYGTYVVLLTHFDIFKRGYFSNISVIDTSFFSHSFLFSLVASSNGLCSWRGFAPNQCRQRYDILLILLHFRIIGRSTCTGLCYNCWLSKNHFWCYRPVAPPVTSVSLCKLAIECLLKDNDEIISAHFTGSKRGSTLYM